MYSLGVSIYDLCFAVHVPSVAIAEQLLSLLPQGYKLISSRGVQRRFRLWEVGGEARGPQFSVSDDTNYVEACDSLSCARDLLKTRIELFLAEKSESFTFVHAGVVRFGGVTVLIPGVSCSGKTSLVACLLQAGGKYLSDEYALLDREGMVHPYSRSLAMRTANSKQYIRPEKLGDTEDRRQVVDLVLLTRYVAGSHWRPRAITRGRAVVEIFQNTLPAIERPKWAIQAIRGAVSNAYCVRGRRGEASQVADWLATR